MTSQDVQHLMDEIPSVPPHGYVAPQWLPHHHTPDTFSTHEYWAGPGRWTIKDDTASRMHQGVESHKVKAHDAHQAALASTSPPFSGRHSMRQEASLSQPDSEVGWICRNDPKTFCIYGGMKGINCGTKQPAGKTKKERPIAEPLPTRSRLPL